MPVTKIDCPTHISNWRVSGMSQTEYCRRNELKPYILTYWKKRIPVKSEEVGFIDITPTQPPPLIEVKLYEGFRFKINLNLSLSWDSRIKER